MQFNSLSLNTNKKTYKIAVVVSEYNSNITKYYLKGVLSVLQEKNIKPTLLLSASGNLELPLVAKTCAEKGVDCIICLGAIISQPNIHNHQLNVLYQETSRGLMNVSLETGIPIVNGVFLSNNEHQAMHNVKLVEDYVRSSFKLSDTLNIIKNSQ